MRFAFPAALWLLALAPVLWLVWWREERERARRTAALVEARLWPLVADPLPVARRRFLRTTTLLAFALWVVALAGPQYGEKTELLPRRGLDVVFAIDVSRSMRARDVLPDRLDRAKAEISAAMEQIGENRVGIVAFAGTAFVQCPLTTDVEAVRLFLKGLDPTVVPQGGTALGLGMRTALDLFESETEHDGRTPTGRVLVVVTDGEDHEGGIEDIGKALKQAQITTVLIGVGSAIGEPIPQVGDDGRVTGYQKDRTGKTIMTRLVPATLQAVADATGGTFVDGTERPDLGMGEVQARLATLEKRDLETRVRREFVDRSVWPACAGLLLLSSALMIPERARRRS